MKKLLTGISVCAAIAVIAVPPVKNAGRRDDRFPAVTKPAPKPQPTRDIRTLQGSLKGAEGKLAVSESSRAAAERDAAEKGKALETASKERDSERARYAETKTELARQDTRSRVQQRDIRTLQSTLKGAEGKLAAANEQVSILKLKLTHNEGTLEAVQQSSAEQKDENRRLNQALMVVRMEKREAEGKLEVIRDMHKETVKKLAEKEAEVRKAHEKNTEAVLAAVMKPAPKPLPPKPQAPRPAPPPKKSWWRFW